MRHILLLLGLLGLLACCTLARAEAEAEAPSVESIERLLVVMRVPRQLELMYKVMDQSMEQGMQAGLKGKQLTADQQRVLSDFRSRTAADMREALAWPVLKPMYLKVYQENFSQQEIDGMTAYYASPVGQSTLEKLPAVMQSISAQMQGRLGTMLERMQHNMQDMLEGLKQHSN